MLERSPTGDDSYLFERATEMIHFLRDKRNNTIVDIEALPSDIRCVVVIEHFAEKLLNLSDTLRKLFIADMQLIQEIRGYYFEKNTWKETPDEIAKKWLIPVAQRWDLDYVTD